MMKQNDFYSEMDIAQTAKPKVKLIEIAIALVIIAVIAGGIIVGKQQFRLAALREQMKQIHDYQTAINLFQEKYDDLPGDAPDADTLFPTALNGNGNNAINIYSDAAEKSGDDSYDSPSPVYWAGEGSDKTVELRQFFIQLSLANLLSEKMNGSNQLGKGIPRTTYNENTGFFVGSVANFTTYDKSRTPHINNYHKGYNAMWFVACNVKANGQLNDRMQLWDDNCAVFSPMDLQHIDSKMDDGMPLSGQLYGFGGTGTNNNCLQVFPQEIQSRYRADDASPQCQAAFVFD